VGNIVLKHKEKEKFEDAKGSELVSDTCLTPTQQFFSNIMARTSQFSMR
jgi:hypothetical protein